MKHARDDYNRIQDPLQKIPDDEPVFLLRGQDITAPETIRHWAYMNWLGDGDRQLIEAAMQQAKKMEYWQATRKRKVADL